MHYSGIITCHGTRKEDKMVLIQIHCNLTIELAQIILWTKEDNSLSLENKAYRSRQYHKGFALPTPPKERYIIYAIPKLRSRPVGYVNQNSYTKKMYRFGTYKMIITGELTTNFAWFAVKKKSVY